MLDWTDRHERYFLRLLSKNAWLYTEMVTTGALIHGDNERYLKFNHQEHPIALQLGGSDVQDMTICAKMAEDFGYDEVNINVGCPSDRVQRGAFGACLMAEPELIAECVSAMQNAVSIPVTVKNRIGIDQQDEEVSLRRFISTVAEAGCNTFIVHARKAWLQGLSPKQNRDIPPLNYDLVYQIKREFPQLEIIINGGITTLDECTTHLQSVDGVMVGREAYHNPYHLIDVDAMIYNDIGSNASRMQILDQFSEYIEARLSEGVPLKHMTRHILGLFQGMTGAKAWRRHISEQAYKPGAGIEVLREAASHIKESE
ncbi:tRNA dihydrouridine(20/20a) synthase DusA [Leucothrix pacifica]|uniref:tRNA-dihydrouridine(20/20a) synthase n=1 Tax=Leucothrix pacifica TaxID=1247513 RepID=A0A317CRY5_9GAMM|nr:tRNA dihydrouridine(20/20a) synthase DusA [Leucothrix pacifica]